MSNLGKREGLVYITVFLWVVMGILGALKGADLKELAVYFGSLTAYVATYIWGESKRPSGKTGIMKRGPNSRREVMIYAVVGLCCFFCFGFVIMVLYSLWQRKSKYFFIFKV